ncbi:unnamed protein product [Porites evermanni]|uniref:Uncharacterized protein n=2 Tax=Porites TaxID=46719 RepID=A0ABN8NZ80_9CNID|nr:unnamed protein product [Porites lobata]CAH3191158.1 unnamed protein product [Porites evermanni]
MAIQAQTIRVKLQSWITVLVILMFTTSFQGSDGRPTSRNLTDTRCLHRLRHRYLFVEYGLHPSNDTQINGESNRYSGEKGGTTGYCPWVWAFDEDVDRIPRYLAKAECPLCGFQCRQVRYWHSTLVQRCTGRSSAFCTWKRKEVPLAISFIYDP